ncbi:serine/threonine protein kinase [Alteribacillus persepolensis]|uniref:Serine/threonine protein kinase n=1 Tax=Alteribacillus persepolensis TaxID=568899 RepID=A0A1G8I0R4_9BACI|nr:serine/threonine protein kinase [Alteribacillus persepolensis]SDI12473.1 serine/threonine protein kinase [Alteribacillus persepolensis]
MVQLKSQASNLVPGTKWLGKWNKNPYRVIRKLGNGATGSVYLVETRTGQAAVKIGENKMSLTSEINVLRHFSTVKGNVLGPALRDVDDIEIKGETFPFFCMEYLKGHSLSNFTKQKGMEWTPILMVQLLGDLDRLHQAGWVFGDLKPENLIVTGPPARIRWFDVGGTTKLGRSVKEYTEFYDRGYWGLGDRKAEPGYDLFSLAMIFIETAYGKRFNKPYEKENSLAFLNKQIASMPSLAPYRKVLLAALKGSYAGAQEMKKDVMVAIETRSVKSSHSVKSGARQKRKPVQPAKKQKNKQRKYYNKDNSVSYRVEVMLTASFLFLSSILYFMGQWM